MPKQKTRKAAAKRFRVTGSGKVVHEKVGMAHLLAHESSKLKRNRRGKSVLDDTATLRVKRMLAMK
jgi:large subunit ribosomal protein L35